MYTIIDENGNVIDRCICFINDVPYNFKMKDNYKKVQLYCGQYIKPQWTGTEWIETATQEELNEAYPSIEQQPTQEDILSKEVANIKIDSMKKDLVITNALQTIASLKVEIMGLKGGNV